METKFLIKILKNSFPILVLYVNLLVPNCGKLHVQFIKRMISSFRFVCLSIQYGQVLFGVIMQPEIYVAHAEEYLCGPC